MTSATAAGIASANQETRGSVLSMVTPAMRQLTMRFAAMAGVNWPIAVCKLTITLQAGDHAEPGRDPSRKAARSAAAA